MFEALATLDNKVAIEIKWPNDLLINDRKVAGMIAQSTPKGVIIGIGINVEMSEVELPVSGATSLSIEKFSELNRNRLLATILNHFEINLQMWELGQSFLPQYRNHCSTIGSEVEVTLPGGVTLQSKALDISDSGALLLESGEQITVGDVVHLR